MNRKIAYFDDDVANLKVYSEILKNKYDVHVYQNPMGYVDILQNCEYSAILIDYYMPIIDGPELFQLIKGHAAYNGCPLIFISSDSSDEIKIHSLTSGGEDFITREMKREEIHARLERRIHSFEKSRTQLIRGCLVVDTENITCELKDELVDVTLTEYKILRLLLKKFPEMVSRDDLIKAAWGDRQVMASTLNTHVSNLRLKFSQWDHDIVAYKGMGYALELK